MQLPRYAFNRWIRTGETYKKVAKEITQEVKKLDAEWKDLRKKNKKKENLEMIPYQINRKFNHTFNYNPLFSESELKSELGSLSHSLSLSRIHTQLYESWSTVLYINI